MSESAIPFGTAGLRMLSAALMLVLRRSTSACPSHSPWTRSFYLMMIEAVIDHGWIGENERRRSLRPATVGMCGR